jgi:prevent-host-death family protein
MPASYAADRLRNAHQNTAAAVDAIASPSDARSRLTRSGGLQNAGNTVNATLAQNQFGKILKDVRHSGPVFIERHGKPQAVVLDINDYADIVRKAQAPEDKKLDELRSEFETLYARMQTKASRKGAEWLSKASADDLNQAARRAKTRG